MDVITASFLGWLMALVSGMIIGYNIKSCVDDYIEAAADRAAAKREREKRIVIDVTPSAFGGRLDE